MNLNPRRLPRAARSILYAMKTTVNTPSMKDYQSAADLQKPTSVENTATRTTRSRNSTIQQVLSNMNMGIRRCRGGVYSHMQRKNDQIWGCRETKSVPDFIKIGIEERNYFIRTGIELYPTRNEYSLALILLLLLPIPAFPAPPLSSLINIFS